MPVNLAAITDNHVRLTLEQVSGLTRTQACDAILRVKNVLLNVCEGRELKVSQKELDRIIMHSLEADPYSEDLFREILLIEPEQLTACAVLDAAFRERSKYR